MTSYIKNNSKKEKWVRRFIIPETNRHKKGFTIYKVTSLIISKESETISKISVWKRFNDFKKLYNGLYHIFHKNSLIKETFPTFPKSNYFGRFGQQVINERRQFALKFLDFISRYRVLYTNDIFIKFFESSLVDDNLSECNQSITTNSDSDDDDDDEDDEDEYNLNRNEKVIPHKRPENEFLKKLNEKIESTFGKNNEEIMIDAGKKKQNNDELLLSNDIELLNKMDNYNRYILVAAAHMSAGYRHESIGEYKEAFMQYKIGITQFRCGIELDPDPMRQIKILEKMKKYIERADKIYKKYLNYNINILLKPINELKRYKVIKIIDSVMLVKDVKQNILRIIKSIENNNNKNDISQFILKEKVPFMVNLHSIIQTDSTIFFVLEYIDGSKLWNWIQITYNSNNNNNNNNNNIFNKDDNNKYLSTDQLVEKAQQLLKSVDATLKRSHSVASKLNDSDYNFILSSSSRCLSDNIPNFNKINKKNDEITNDKLMIKVPEKICQLWAAQLILALQVLHQQNIILTNLNPDNLLIDNTSHITLCFVIPRKLFNNYIQLYSKKPYIAPELYLHLPFDSITPAVDIWSFGVIIYEILTGIPFQQLHPTPFHSHSIITIPKQLSDSAKSLLINILKFKPEERLTITEIKKHSFFKTTDWTNLK